MKLMIATPTAQGTVTTAYARTLAAAISVAVEAGAGHALAMVDGADVVSARTLLARAFLADASASHLLFIDSDMAVEAEVLRRMLALGAPVVGCAYARRQIDLGAFAAAMAETPDRERARALASGFTVRLAAGQVAVRDGFAEVQGFGLGCALIARGVFEAMIARGVVGPMTLPRFREADEAGGLFDFFAEMRLEDGTRLAEDFAFCERVRRLGDVPLPAWVGPGVGHVGAFTYGGAFVERLKAGKA